MLNLGFQLPAAPTPKQAEIILATIQERDNAVCIRNKAAMVAVRCRNLAAQTREEDGDEDEE